MPQSAFSVPISKVIERPLCPQCGATMMLSRIEPSMPDVDQRTFDCKCGHSQSLLVKYR